MLENCQGTDVGLLCIYTPLILLIGLIIDCAPFVLTLMGRLYRRRYQLVFFKTSAKDIKNTPLILVV